VRVNGREVQEAELKPGDTVELGQVRFRFVGSGEQFVFDGARTLQVNAVTPERPPPSRVPFLAAGAIIVTVALVVAIGTIIASGRRELEVIAGGGPDHPPAQGAPVAGTDVPAPLPLAPGVGVDELVTRCQAALNAGQYDVAVQRATEALAAQAGHAGALACLRRAEEQRADSETFARGLAHLTAGELESAYFEFEQLSPHSAFRQREEVVRAMRAFAEEQLSQAEQDLPNNAEEALRRAQLVQNMSSVDLPLRQRANEIARRAQSRVHGPIRTASRTPERGPTDGSARSAAGSSRIEPGRPSGGGTASEGPAAGQMLIQQARACFANGGGNPCVLRVLEGRARSPDELQMLIATYQATGNTPRMLDTMDQFVRRYPDHPRTSQYRQILSRHGR
jgi:hypothetical protein